MTRFLDSWRAPNRQRRVFLLIVTLLACLLVVSRHQLYSGLNLLAGDRFDVVISTTILEHWYKVFTGSANWSDVGYFYPYTRTIAQTDAYFLPGLAYFPFRATGLDPFLAAEMGNMVIKSIGLFGTYLLCRRAFGLPVYWALLAGALFMLSNGVTSHAARVQLTTVALAPVVALLLWQALTAVYHDDARRFLRNGLAGGILYGAWCLSCFYMAWFFAFFMTVLLVIVAVRSDGAAWGPFLRHLRSMPLAVLGVIAGTALAMGPFVWAFLPKSQEVGVRTFESVSANILPLEGVLQVGRTNLLFGELYNDLLARLVPSYRPVGEYYDTGFSLTLFAVFVCGCAFLWRKARVAGKESLLVSVAEATLISWVLSLNIAGHTGWYFVYHFFPGAKALNVVALFQLMLALPVIVIAVKFLAHRQRGPLFSLALGTLLIVGELNTPYLNLNRPKELARLGQPPAPPAACKAFYTSGWSNAKDFDGFPKIIYGAYAHNVSAMMLAQMVGIPTLNGTASFTPRDWNFGDPSAADYDDRMIYYALQHKVQGLCKYDLNNRQWFVLNRFMQVGDRVGTYADTIDFSKKTWNGVLATGLSFAEPWGTWSAEKNVSFEFAAPLPETFDLHVTAHALGPNSGKPVTITVGKQSRTITIGAEDTRQTVRFSNVLDASTLVITVPQPTTPKSLGWGDDERTLGIGFKQIQIEKK
jgi:hypothetical protein